MFAFNQQGQAPNVMQTSANLFNQAAQGPNIQGFMNPYTQNVVDATAADMERGRQLSMNTIGQQASAAGAFGGSRHGIAEAESNRAYYDNFGRMMAGLRADGYNNAVGNAFQNQQMQSQLAGQGFGFGTTLNQQMLQQGQLQQQLNQQLIDAGKMQYLGFTGAPVQGVQLINSVLGNMPNVGTQTQSSNPGGLGLISTFL